MATKVFISHSAKSQDHQDRLLQFATALRDEDLEPWVDRERIRTGAPWNAEITKGLHECHAAVILFSRDALASDFVKYEVSCLTNRKRTAPSFGLYPMILDDTPIETITNGFFGAIAFGDYQIGDFVAKQQEVIDALKSLDPELVSPSNAIEDVLLTIFTQIAPNALRDAAADPKVDWPTWQGVGLPDAEALNFVRCLLAAPLAQQIAALNGIKAALPAGRSIGEVFNLIAPFWVDEDAALRLHDVHKASPGKRNAIINGTHGNFTCEAYLKRARPMKDSGVLSPSPPAAGAGDALLGAATAVGRRTGADLEHQIRRALCHHFNLDEQPNPRDTDADLDAEIEFDESVDRHPIEVLQLSERELPILKQLASCFRRVTFVAMTGEHLPQIDASLGDCASIIEPTLAHDKTQTRHNERYAYAYWCRRERLLGINNS